MAKTIRSTAPGCSRRGNPGMSSRFGASVPSRNRAAPGTGPTRWRRHRRSRSSLTTTARTVAANPSAMSSNTQRGTSVGWKSAGMIDSSFSASHVQKRPGRAGPKPGRSRTLGSRKPRRRGFPTGRAKGSRHQARLPPRPPGDRRRARWVSRAGATSRGAREAGGKASRAPPCGGFDPSLEVVTAPAERQVVEHGEQRGD